MQTFMLSSIMKRKTANNFLEKFISTRRSKNQDIQAFIHASLFSLASNFFWNNFLAIFSKIWQLI